MEGSSVGKGSLWAGRIVSAIPVLMLLMSGIFKVLGGAMATHARVLQGAFFAPAVLGAFAWLGLYLRDPRLRALLPLRRDP